jgi:flagellar biosynthesis/type III secretory pathway ATPase
MLPRLLERSGQGQTGSITAIYTVLVEGGDMDEPIADEVRGILDGHIVLDRRLASRGHYPAVDVLQSLSRVMDAVVSKEHVQAARRMRQLLAAYESKRDLIVLGAYARGSDGKVDEAIQKMPKIEAFLQQPPDEVVGYDQVVQALGSAIR